MKECNNTQCSFYINEKCTYPGNICFYITHAEMDEIIVENLFKKGDKQNNEKSSNRP